jgi:ethanolamine permease
MAHGWAGQDQFSMAAVGGIFAALPFAIWFFLAIEGVAMAAEEAKKPRRTIPIAYISGILTLTVLAFGVMLFAGGSGNWAELSGLNDPLPQAMKRVVGASSGWLYMLVWLGLFGLVASFHGIIMGYARQIFALGRAGYLPSVFAQLHPRFKTPHVATLAGGVVGIATIYSDAFVQIAGQSLTASVVTLSAFGALTMYIVSMAALFRLRRSEPGLARPFRAPLYPFVPAFALGMASLALLTMVYNNRTLAGVFAGLMAVLVGSALLFRRKGAT